MSKILPMILLALVGFLATGSSAAPADVTVHHIAAPAPIGLATFSPDGEQVLSSSIDRVLRLWDIESGEMVISREVRSGVLDLKFLPDGEHFLCAWPASAVATLHRADDLSVVREFDCEAGTVRSLDVSADGRFAVMGVSDSLASVSRQIAEEYFDGAEAAIDFAEVHLWEIETGNRIHHLITTGDDMYAVAISPDGRQAAVGVLGDMFLGRIELWDLVSGVRAAHFEFNDGTITDIEYLPFEGLIGVGFYEANVVRIIDTRRRRSVRETIQGAGTPSGQGPVGCVAFSPDGRRFLTGGQALDQLVRLWDLNTCQVIETYDWSHRFQVGSVDFSPDGRMALSAASDYSIRIWELPE